MELIYGDNRGMSSRMFASYSVVPAISLGVQDSFNPCAIVTIIIFFLFLKGLRAYEKKFTVPGLCFIASLIVTKFLVSLSYLDEILSLRFVDTGIKMTYLGIAGLFVVLGIIHFIDWIRFKQDGSATRFILKPLSQWRSFKELGSKESRFRRFLEVNYFPILVLIAFLSGFLMTFLESAWPEDYLLYATLHNKMMAGNLLSGIAFMFYYSLSFSITFLFILIIYMLVTKNKKLTGWLADQVSLIKIFSSAVFLSTGIGITFLFLK